MNSVLNTKLIDWFIVSRIGERRINFITITILFRIVEGSFIFCKYWKFPMLFFLCIWTVTRVRMLKKSILTFQLNTLRRYFSIQWTLAIGGSFNLFFARLTRAVFMQSYASFAIFSIPCSLYFCLTWPWLSISKYKQWINITHCVHSGTVPLKNSNRKRFEIEN